MSCYLWQLDLEKLSKTMIFLMLKSYLLQEEEIVSKGHDLDGFGVEVVFGIEERT